MKKVRLGFQIHTQNQLRSHTDMMVIKTYEGPGDFANLLDFSTTALPVPRVTRQVQAMNKHQFGEFVWTPLETTVGDLGTLKFEVTPAHTLRDPKVNAYKTDHFELKFLSGMNNCNSYFLECRINGILTWDCQCTTNTIKVYFIGGRTMPANQKYTITVTTKGATKSTRRARQVSPGNIGQEVEGIWWNK